MSQFDAKADTPDTSVAAGDKLPFGDVSADQWNTITAAKLLKALAEVTDELAAVKTLLGITEGGGGMQIGGAVTSGTAGRVLYVGAGGVLAEAPSLGVSPSTGAVSITTTGTVEPAIQVTGAANATGLVGRFSRTGEASLSVVMIDGTTAFLVSSGSIALCYGGSTSNRIFQQSGQRLVLMETAGASAAGNLPANGVGLGNNLPLYGTTWSTTVEGRVRWSIEGTTAVNTDATRQYGCDIKAWDWTGGRTGVSVRADGTQVLCGFFGATPVARPTLPGAGTVTVADIRAALISLGLCQ